MAAKKTNVTPSLLFSLTTRFQPWPKDALVSVATHFLGHHEFQCSAETKRQLFKTMAQVQDSVSQACNNYFLKFRRSAHVTPKSFLSFINSYKDVYQRKEEDIGDMAARMNSGLGKLQEASRYRMSEAILSLLYGINVCFCS